MVGIPEDLGYILSRQDEITGSDPRIFDQLRQDFPKYLGVNSSQDAERSACGHQFQEGKRAADIEFPGRKKETPTRVVHFKGGLFAMPDLSGLAFCASQLFGQTGRGEARGFIGKGRGGGCPAGDDQVAFGKTVILFERGECKHVFDDGETRSAVGTVDEGIVIAAVRWVEEFAQAVGAVVGSAVKPPVGGSPGYAGHSSVMNPPGSMVTAAPWAGTGSPRGATRCQVANPCHGGGRCRGRRVRQR